MRSSANDLAPNKEAPKHHKKQVVTCTGLILEPGHLDLSNFVFPRILFSHALNFNRVYIIPIIHSS